MADAILHALTMPEDERRRRMAKMREAVAENNVYRWAGQVPVGPDQVRVPGGEPGGQRGELRRAAPAGVGGVTHLPSRFGEGAGGRGLIVRPGERGALPR